MHDFSGEAGNTNFNIVFDLTPPGLERKIYHTRVGIANHYTSDEINKFDYSAYENEEDL